MDPAACRKAAIEAVRQLSADVGIPAEPEKLREEDLPFLCESAAADACAPGNPRPAALAEFETMFRKLMVQRSETSKSAARRTFSVSEKTGEQSSGISSAAFGKHSPERKKILTNVAEVI